MFSVSGVVQTLCSRSIFLKPQSAEKENPDKYFRSRKNTSLAFHVDGVVCVLKSFSKFMSLSNGITPLMDDD